jgi:hypothetical protein
MTSQTLRTVHDARPFVPFRLNLADGRKLDVRHPEVLAYIPGGRTAIFVHEDERTERIDPPLVVSVEELHPPGRPPMRRRSA